MQPNWQNDFLYPTRHHQKLMQKYNDFFSSLFTHKNITFGYIKRLKEGGFMGISNLLKHEESYLETEGYKDDPHFPNYENTPSNRIILHSENHSQNEEKHTSFRNKIKKELGTRTTLSIIRKSPACCHLFWWGFQSTTLPTIEEHNIILKSWFNHANLMEACLEQFKKEFFPLVEKKELMRINFNELRTPSHNAKEKPHSAQNDSIDLMLKIKLLDTKDLWLKNVKLSDQEYQCLEFFLQGKTAKETAEEMSLSKRTVEEYLDNLKNKLKCLRKNELHEIAKKLRLLNVI